MKKFLLLASSVLLLLSLVIPVSATTADNPLVVDLIAGQNQDAGDIKVWDDGTTLYVQYETTNPWCLTETHLAVASSLEGIPQKNGNPIPGQFPYKHNHGCTTSFLYTIPLDSSSCELYIAAHAVVKAPGSTETAWGSGIGFPGRNWATYFIYKTNACSYTPTPSQTNTATSTPTNTPTATPTNTPTSTPTNTPTNTATFTPTNTPTDTPTNTPTNTPTVCQPTLITADFSNIPAGESVEGMSVVAPNLNIDAKGTAIKVAQNAAPVVYGAPNAGSNAGNPIANGGLSPNGGFSDLTTKTALQAHQYTFTFAPNAPVSSFSLHMLDYGDFDPTQSPNHYVSMTAYDVNNNIVSVTQLAYLSEGMFSAQYGDLNLSGDAVSAQPGQPGNWTWNVFGSGIVKVVLSFGDGYDPNIGFDTLSFVTDCQTCALVKPDFSSFAPGTSVEGMGAVVPNLNIDAKGTAISLREGMQPAVYAAPNTGPVLNGGMAATGGFSDLTTKNALQPHEYTFTFAPSAPVSSFSVHMLDYGDLNPTQSPLYFASMTAYDANDKIVSVTQLAFFSNGSISPQYGDLAVSGDAVTALPGQPGNWIWNVYGSGIVKVVLSFGDGYDPNVGFDILSFCPQSP